MRLFLSPPCLAVPMAPLPLLVAGDSHSPGHDKGVFILPVLTEGLYVLA